MLTLPVDQWIGNAAAVLSGTWGAITRRSEQSGYSRMAIYTHATRVVQAVANEQAGGLSYEELWADHERLRAENQALWQAWTEAEELSEAKQREVAASGSAMGLSLTQVVTVLAIVLPRGIVPSRATVGRWVQQAAGQAGRILEVLDRACQARVLVLCLDEIFFHREPILMGIEPDSLVWVAGQRGPDRSGESWRQVIENWPCLEHVIADGGTGLERGVKLANEDRSALAQESESVSPVAITMGLDIFHPQREPSGSSRRRVRPIPRWPRLSSAGGIHEAGRGQRGGPGAKPKHSSMRRSKRTRRWTSSKPRCRGLMPGGLSIADRRPRRSSTRRWQHFRMSAGARPSGC